MENSVVSQCEMGNTDAMKAKVSLIVEDLKRIGDRLLEVSTRMEASTSLQQNACACANGEADHVEFLLPDFESELHQGGDPVTKSSWGTVGEEDQPPAPEGGEEESPAHIPRVLEELRRHLARMEHAGNETGVRVCEVAELGYELLGCEREMRVFIEKISSRSEQCPSQEDKGVES